MESKKLKNKSYDIYEKSSDLFDSLNKRPEIDIEEYRKYYGFKKEKNND